jgi:protein SDA1
VLQAVGTIGGNSGGVFCCLGWRAVYTNDVPFTSRLYVNPTGNSTAIHHRQQTKRSKGLLTFYITMASSCSASSAPAPAGSTGAGSRVDVTLKLSQLQNFCKRDPKGYRAEYDAQVRRLESELQILALTGSASHAAAAAAGGSSSSSRKSGSAGSTGTPLQELMQFVAAVASSSYKGQESDRIAQLFVRLLVGSSREDDDEEEEDTAGGSSNVEDAGDKLSVKGKGGARSSGRRRNGAAPSRPTIRMDARSVTFLADSALQLDRSIRQTAVSCLILMRNKGAIDPLYLLPIFFRLMAVVPDKALREVLYRHTVQDVSNLNKKTRNEPLNRALQGFFHRIVETHSNSTASGTSTPADEDATECATVAAARQATNLVAELYRRRVWTDAKTVAILASAVLSSHPTVTTRALRFFLNIEEKMAGDELARQAEKLEAGTRIDYHPHSKKTAARQRHVERQNKNRSKLLRRQQEAEGNGDGIDDGHLKLAHDKGVEASKKLYPAIELLRDPQGLAEGTYRWR